MNKQLNQTNNIALPSFIATNIPLKDKNWFATGGNARYFYEPTTAHEFQQAVAFAHLQQIPLFVLGQGANILISDEGFDGLVIRPQLQEIKIFIQNGEHFVKAGAGVTMPDLILFCLNNNLIGLEEFSGIPGTVGGSVYINLHYFQFLLAQFIVEATIIDRKSGLLHIVEPSWFEFGYNQSKLHDEKHYLVDATFKLTKATDIQTAFAQGRSIEIIRHRHSRYPSKNTCGSFFRNFFDHEVALTSNGKKMIYIAYYLDKIGVKGQLQVGGAIVSYQHANMLVNQGNATSSDIIALARTMQEMVKNEYSIVPQPECRLIGFKEFPLL